MDEEQEKRLWQREKQRRRALWQLQGLRPGDPAAAEWLVMLSEVEFLERSEPIGDGYQLTIGQLRSMVPVVDLRGFRIVRDDDIPEPWLERFGQASTGSTRLPEGSYGRDWLRFLSMWEQEMAHLQQHRNRHSSPKVASNDD
ncbi:hypothetical protein [Pseudomonas sp. NMI542_15]|uniref:hypothetical protein n=1 Tax=Pseudomonas sp. NMI542_15 TaxID=2903148 RepID=UPI001E58EDDF|nr:hypothetical protein [Pseudomonas sp. NMI542_15]MCE0782886.1 hypothetical protein [Pseudomonas sp. NMI542_15]